MKVVGLLTVIALASCSSPPAATDVGADTRASADVGADEGRMADDGPPPRDASSPDVGFDADAPDLPNVVPTAFEDFCTGLAVHYARWLSQCYGAANYDPTDEILLARFAEQCLVSAPSAAAGRISYDDEQATRCLAALDGATCDRFVFFTRTPECVGVTTGAQALSDSCYATAGNYFAIARECADGWCSTDACPGSCQPFNQADEPCGDAGGECDPASTWCDYAASTCRSYSADGQPCVSGTQCQSGLECLSSVCTAAIALGQACSEAADLCESGTFCSGGTCQTRVATGEPCRSYLNCADGETCLGPEVFSGMASGVCAPRGTGGATCYAAPTDCAAGFACVGGVCASRPAIGMPCEDRSFCAAGAWCRHEVVNDDGVCTALGAAGSACSHGYGSAAVNGSCLDDLYCVDGACRARGELNDPCSNTIETCASELFCSRTTKTCVARGASGEACNPIWPISCAPGLSCHCAQDDASCDQIEPDANPGDSCAPAQPLGATCWRGLECASGQCADHDADGTPTCQPGLCLP